MPLVKQINADIGEEVTITKIIGAAEMKDYAALLKIEYTLSLINNLLAYAIWNRMNNLIPVLNYLGAWVDSSAYFYSKEEKERENGTALHLAIKLGNVDTIKAVLDCHPDFFQKDSKKRDIFSFLHSLPFSEEQRANIVDLLKQYNITPDKFVVVPLNESSVKQVSMKKCIQLVAANNVMELIQELHKMGDSYCDQIDVQLERIQHGMLSEEYLLLASAIDERKPWAVIHTLLMPETIKEGLRRGADGGLVLWSAIRRSNLELIKELRKMGMDMATNLYPNGKACHYYLSPLYPAIAENDDEALVQLLLISGANKVINVAKPETGHTPLMKAAEVGAFKIVRLLLQQGADPHVRDVFGFTALDLANKIEIKKILQQAVSAEKLIAIPEEKMKMKSEVLTHQITPVIPVSSPEKKSKARDYKDEFANFEQKIDAQLQALEPLMVELHRLYEFFEKEKKRAIQAKIPQKVVTNWNNKRGEIKNIKDNYEKTKQKLENLKNKIKSQSGLGAQLIQEGEKLLTALIKKDILSRKLDSLKAMNIHFQPPVPVTLKKNPVPQKTRLSVFEMLGNGRSLQHSEVKEVENMSKLTIVPDQAETKSESNVNIVNWFIQARMDSKGCFLDKPPFPVPAHFARLFKKPVQIEKMADALSPQLIR